MRNKITVGIPKAFLYYRYASFWKYYFKKIGCNVLISKDTTKETINIGKKYTIDESCLASKIYTGHVYSLLNKCDYIFIPRISDYGAGEKVCMKFNGIYDVIKNIFPKAKILSVNIEKTKFKSESTEYIKLGLKLNKNIAKVIYAYIYAKYKEKKIHRNKLLTQLKKIYSSNKVKILIVAHPYNIYDKYIGNPIIKILENMNIEPIYADIIDRKISKNISKKITPTLYWTYSKELVGSINYYMNHIDGIIFITTFPCGPDSLVNELMIRKINNIPITNILIDESNADAGIQTRLESFIDIIKERKKYNEQNNYISSHR